MRSKPVSLLKSVQDQCWLKLMLWSWNIS